MYSFNFVEDDEFWDEICVLCDWATAVTEREKCDFGYSPERDVRPVEYIYVQARFHYNAERPDEPWHITVDFGNRNTWDNGNGFFRRGYHIYAKNNDLSQGYASYTSPTNRKPIGKMELAKNKDDLPLSAQIGAEPGMSTSLHDAEATAWVPWGTRDYYRHPRFRGYLHRTVHHSLKPPTALSKSRARRAPWSHHWDPITGSYERKSRPTIQDELDDLIYNIRDGASKPASPAKEPDMVRDLSGSWVHISQAVSDARKEGKEISKYWQVVLQEYNASRLRLKRTARPLGATRARSVFDKTRRATRATTRFQNRDPKSKRLEGTQKSSRPRSKMRGSLKEGLAGKELGRSTYYGMFEFEGRARRLMSRPEVNTKSFDLKQAMLDAEAELEACIHRKEGPKARKTALGDRSARASAKRPQKSSMSKASSDYSSPVPSGRRRSPKAPIKRSGESGVSEPQKSEPDTSKAGKKTSSPLPPADVDLARKWDKKMKKSFEARRHGLAVKKAPALVLPPSAGEATF